MGLKDYSNIDRRNLTLDQHAQIEQLQSLQEIEQVVELIQTTLDSFTDKNKTDLKSLGAAVVDIRESLQSLNSKESPEIPDYAKPVVERLDKLEKAFTDTIKNLKLNPEVKVSAPDVKVPAPVVNVESPTIDITPIKKAIAELNKGLKDGISSIPQPKEIDFEPLVERLDNISAQLVDVETAARLKPLPGSMKVTNPDGSYIGQSLETARFDIDGDPYYIGVAPVGSAETDPVWIIYRYELSSLGAAAGKIATSAIWSDRLTETYL